MMRRCLPRCSYGISPSSTSRTSVGREMPSSSAASCVVSSAFWGMTVTPCPWAIAVATWTRASNTGPGTSRRRPSAPTRAGLGSGTATPRRASSVTKSTTSASCVPSRRMSWLPGLPPACSFRLPFALAPSVEFYSKRKKRKRSRAAARLRKLTLVLGFGSRSEPREVGRGAAVDLGNRVSVMPQCGRASAAVAEAGCGVA